MPTASAGKRTRQRANKLKSSASSAQSPEIIPPALQMSTPPPTSIDFETFIDLADLDDIPRFFDAIASMREGRNLKLLWNRAFEAGLNQGRKEERDFRDEIYRQGKAQGIKEAEEAASCAKIDFYLHGIEKGRSEERSEWTSAGHGLHCLTPVAILANEGTQTDAESPSTATCDTSIQTPDPPLLVVSPQIANAPPFDWADDATSLPIQILPKPLLPRDFSELRSPKQNPFSSLQHRAKRFTRYSHQPHCRHSHLKFNSFYSPHRNSYKQFQPHFQSKTHSHLNWESDPRLSDLSRSLKALGWIRAS